MSPISDSSLREKLKENWTMRIRIICPPRPESPSWSRRSLHTLRPEPPRIQSLQIPETGASIHIETIVLRPRVARTAIQPTQFRQCNLIQTMEFKWGNPIQYHPFNSIQSRPFSWCHPVTSVSYLIHSIQWTPLRWWNLDTIQQSAWGHSTQGHRAWAINQVVREDTFRPSDVRKMRLIKSQTRTPHNDTAQKRCTKKLHKDQLLIYFVLTNELGSGLQCYRQV